jgi:hypothetical protein
VLNNGSGLIIESSGSNNTVFENCSSSNDFGGGIYIQMNETVNLKFGKGLKFISCSAKSAGENMFIFGKKYYDYVNEKVFEYDYYESLPHNNNELLGFDGVGDIHHLREFLCPLQKYDKNCF